MDVLSSGGRLCQGCVGKVFLVVGDSGLLRRGRWRYTRSSKVRAVELCLGIHEDNHHKAETDHGGVEPPEVPPADCVRHWAGDYGTNHEGAEVGHKVKRVPFSTVVQEEQV